MKLPITIPRVTGATPIDRATLCLLIGAKAVVEGEMRFTSTHVGPWHICRSITGLCTAHEGGQLTIYGMWTAHGITQPGSWSEGRVSVAGKKRTCFTSSQMFVLPCGKLVDVAVLHLHS
jgi:hypothetical protein